MLVDMQPTEIHKSHDYIKCKCDKCGYTGKIRYDHFSKSAECPVCTHHKIVSGINDLCTLAPHIAALLKDPLQGRTVGITSHQKLDFKCPDCGFVKQNIISDVSRRGFSCPRCSVKISYPNRFMSAFLETLGIKFSTEVSFQWCGKKRYDFYLEEYNTIVEMHGKQHFSGFTGGAFISLDKIISNDDKKRELALKNGVERYIEIDASESTKEYISKNIVESELSELVCVDNVDWDSIAGIAEGSMYKRIVSDYNQDLDFHEISERNHVSIDVVRRILKTAAKNGDCDYSRENQQNKTQQYAAECRKKKVKCITTGMFFDSVREAASHYNLTPKQLSNCLCGRCKTTKAKGGERLQWTYQ